MGKSNNPYGVALNQVWIEVDPRHQHMKEVIEVDEAKGKARIKRPDTGKTTWARLERFHGKRGGYKRV